MARMMPRLLLVALLGLASAHEGQAQPPAGPKAVLVTGASSGIGRKITERLAADGYFVYAGARKDEDLKALGAIRNVQAIRLDVDDVAVAVENALFGPTPKRRYMVVPDEEEAERTVRKQFERLVQLNEGQRYTYDRATLIRMLDDALAGSRSRTR